MMVPFWHKSTKIHNFTTTEYVLKQKKGQAEKKTVKNVHVTEKMTETKKC